MKTRQLILASLIALPLSAGGLWLYADEKPARPAPPTTPSAPPSKDNAGNEPRENGSREKDSRDKDSREDRRSRGDWGGPRFGPPGPPSDAKSNSFNQFSADELRLMIDSVQPRNARLAQKMKERFADALTNKPDKLSPEQIEAVLSVFEDREPYLAGRIKQSFKDNPDRVAIMLAFHWPRLEKAIELKKTDRELYDAQTAEILKQGETRGLFWKLRKAMQDKNEAEATKLQNDIKANLHEQHKARQAIRKLELERMNDKITKLSEEITAEESRSAQLIDKQFNEMLKWATQPRPERGSERGPSRGEKTDRPDRPENKDQPQ